MQNLRLLASVSLFRELYDNKKDIYDVISEFLRATISISALKSFNVTECNVKLEEYFGFQIPDAVIKTCLRNRLRKNGELDITDGHFIITQKFEPTKNLDKEYQQSIEEYNSIVNQLIQHIEAEIYSKTNDLDKQKIKEELNEYLISNRYDGKYTNYISQYFLYNEHNSEFRSKISKIEEGIILYTGVRYTPDLSKLGSWDKDLTIYLDTEHLFNATGLNGVLFKKIFDDFYNLTSEANHNKKNKGKIFLKYLDSTEKEIEDFFYASEMILTRKKSIDPSKTAMVEILKDCHSASDVVVKKSNFISHLKKLKIFKESSDQQTIPQEYNLVSIETATELQRKFNNKTTIETFIQILNNFSIINSLRRTNNSKNYYDISYVFLTGNSLTLAVSHSDIVYNEYFPFAIDIEYLTERLWFKLKKGFSVNNNSPASFDIITKSKIVISSQVNKAVSKTYKELNSKYEKGEINSEQAHVLLHELRNKQTASLNITKESLKEIISFLSDDLIEKSIREQSLLKKQASESTILKSEIREIRHQHKREKQKPIKESLIWKFKMLMFSAFALPILISISLITYFSSTNDTILSLISVFFTITPVLYLFISREKITRHLKRRMNYQYKIQISHLTKN